jgi:hypothetical protein
MRRLGRLVCDHNTSGVGDRNIAGTGPRKTWRRWNIPLGLKRHLWRRRRRRRLRGFVAGRRAVPAVDTATVAARLAAIDAAGAVLGRILVDLDSDLLLAGDAFRADEAALNARTFVRRDGDVIVRRAEVGGDFCNHLYTDPTGASARAVVCLNTAFKSVTVSLADPDKETVSCRDLVQGLWGPEAGGHRGIGGGPREVAFDETHLEAALYAMVAGLAS